MVNFASRVIARVARADRRMHERISRRARDDDGFVLLETIIAIGLISVVMAAFTTFFVNSVANVNQQRADQAAAQLADSAVDLMRSLPASDLVAGHDSTSVGVEFSGAPARVSPALQTMNKAVDSTAAVNAGRTATIPTVAVAQTVNNIVYSVTSYLGTCVVPTGALLNASCGLGAASSGTSYLRAVVGVTWTGAHCATAVCNYVTSTLLSPDSDPTFNLNQTPPTVPHVTTSDQVSTVGETVSLQLNTDSGTGVPTLQWAVTNGTLPAGLAISPTGIISGVPTTVAPATPITVTVTDGLGRTASSTFKWTIVGVPTITTPANQTTPINTAVSLAVLSTCPNSPCTYALANGPVGLSIDNTGLITGRPTVAGTVSVTVTITDKDGIAATTNSFSWSVLSPASVCQPSVALPNGGFEAPAVSPGAPNWEVGGSSPLLWDTTETDNVVELWGNGGNVQSANGGIPISAEDGTSWAELNANDVGALYQDLTTVPGQVLQWSVWHRARGIGGGNTTGQDVMQVQIGSSSSQSAQVPTGQTTANISDGPLAWVRYTGLYTVPAGQTTTRFQFAAISTASGDRSVGNFIDNLSLNNNVACLTTAATDQTSTQNTAIAPFKVSVDRGTGPFVWGGGSTLPPGLSIAADGTITGTPTTVGSTSVTLNFSDSTGFAQTVSFNWAVVPRPSITAPGSQSGSLGSAVNLTLTKSCYNTPCTYVVNNGPSGLTVSTTGVVTGTITGSAQVYNNVSVTVTDASGATATTSTFKWTVLAAPTVGNPANQSSTVGQSVNLTVASTCANAPCTFALANAPAGLSIGNSGVITGSPTTAGTSTNVIVTITDASGVTATTNAFTWTVTRAAAIGTLANATWSVSNSAAGAKSVTYLYTYSTVTTANNLTSITITVPAGTAGTPIPTITGFTASNASASLSGTTLTVTFNPVYVLAGTNVSISLAGMTNTATTGSYTAQVVTNGALNGGAIILLDSATVGPVAFTTNVLTVPVWSVSNSTASAKSATYYYTFTTATTATMSSVTMSVPPGTAGTPTVTVTGLPAGTIALSGGVLTYTLNTPTSVAAGTAVNLTVGGITNTGVVGTYTSQLVTRSASGVIDSAPTGPVSFTAGTLASAVWSVSTSAAGATNVTYSYSFTTATAANNLSYLTMTVPPGTSLSAGATVTVSAVSSAGAQITLSGAKVSLSGTVLTVSVNSAPLAGGANLAIKVTGVTNTSAVDDYTSQVVTNGALNGGAIIGLDSATTGSISFSAGTLANAVWSVSNSAISAKLAAYTYRFSTATAATLSSVTMSVPPGTAGTPTVVVTGLGAGRITLSGTLLTFTITAPVAVTAGKAVTIVVSGLTNTAVVGSYSSQIVTDVTTAGATVPNDSAPAGPISFTAGTLTSPSWQVSKTGVGATNVSYTYGFTTATTANGLTSLTATVPPGTGGTPTVTVAGVPGTVATLSGTLLTVTLPYSVNVAAGTAVSITINGLTNTAVAGSYTSQIVTQGSTNGGASVPLDSASTSAIAFS